MNQETTMRIDVDEVLRQRLPRHYKYIPKFLIRWVERTICQERMNELLVHLEGKKDAEFCRKLMSLLNITVNVNGEEKLPSPENRRVVIVSNHPLGGLDGIAYIDYITRVYGGKVNFIVNDILMVLKPLHGVFLPINKHGKQSRQSFKAIEEAFAGNDPIIIFPAGLVSRRSKDGGIADLRWQKMFVNKCIEHQRDVIPMFFGGENSAYFYNFAKWRKRIGLKFNIEMVYLPREMCQSENAVYSINIGDTISWELLKPAEGKNTQDVADQVREIVYKLKP